MGSRSRKRRTGAERDAEVRAQLEPLGAGERPRAVTIAAALAAVIGAGNLLLYASGYEIRGEEPSLGGVVALSGVMLVAAYYMWRCRYWAVLGFQALMAVTCVFAGLSLMVASNVEAAVRSTAILVGAGLMFWFLVKALARLQMPQRPGGREE